MGQYQLCGLMIFSIESDLANKVSYEEVISHFAAKKPPCVCLLRLDVSTICFYKPRFQDLICGFL